MTDINQAKQSDAPFSKKALIAYLYFVQGIFLAICATVPLTYKVLPDYNIMGYFSAATLPFSFKFITAPLVQKYSHLAYGRRKFWIVISMTLTSFILYLISHIVQNQQKQIQTAILLALVILCVSIQDISTDGLGIKQLRKPQLSSLLQSIFQQLGFVGGSLSLGQLTSQRLGTYFGYDSAIISPSQFIIMLIPFIIFPTLWIHFNFKQSFNAKQSNIRQLSLWEVTKHYKHFLLPKYRVCRQALLFLTMFHSITIFSAGYSLELIKSEILSKQFLISLGNLSLILIFPATFVLSKYVTLPNLQKFQKYFYFIRCSFIAFVFLIDSKSPIFATFAIFFFQLLGSLHFYLHGIIMNSFQDSKFQGMSVTMMASMSNLGRNQTLHLNLIGKFGFSSCVYCSFAYSAIFGIILKPFHNWVNKGQQEDQQQQILQHPHNE